VSRNDSKLSMDLASIARQCSKRHVNSYHECGDVQSSRFCIHNHFIHKKCSCWKMHTNHKEKKPLTQMWNQKTVMNTTEEDAPSASWNINSVLIEIASVIQRHFLWTQLCTALWSRVPWWARTWEKFVVESNRRNDLIHDHYSRLENF
jgi:hypothetical protein